MKSTELLRMVERAGWVVVRQEGSHRILKHPDRKNTLVVPFHAAKEVGKGLANKILKQAGLK